MKGKQSILLLMAACLTVAGGGNAYGAHWKYERSSWYYINDSGNYSYGWIKDGNSWYYAEKSGSIYTNAIKNIDGKKYYFQPSGAIVCNGWYLDYDDTWYYFGSDGAAVSGWMKINNIWYYFDTYGKMVKDKSRVIDGNKYYFNADGAMKANTYVGAKFLNRDGVNDSRYDIKLRGKVGIDVLDECGNNAANVPGWLLQHVFESGWKMAYNEERPDYGKTTHEDYDDGYMAYYNLETSRKLIFFTKSENVLQGIGMFIHNDYNKPGESVEFQGAYSMDYDNLKILFEQQPIIEKNKAQTFAEVFALYYNKEDYIVEDLKNSCPNMYEFMYNYMQEYYNNKNIKE